MIMFRSLENSMLRKCMLRVNHMCGGRNKALILHSFGLLSFSLCLHIEQEGGVVAVGCAPSIPSSQNRAA